MNKPLPTFSLITPVYNGEKFVLRCYSNIIQQLNTDWEWVIVNDGSTDKTLEIISSIKDSRIKIISYEKNKGRGFARNLAIENSIGDWIVCCDIDDLHFPDRLNLIKQSIDDGFDFFCSYALLINNNLEVKGVRAFSEPHGIFSKGFVHPTLACKKSILLSIKYGLTKGRGAPAEDARVLWILSLKYKGCWHEDALTLYQEDREVNIIKSILSNKGHLATLFKLKSEGYYIYNFEFIKTVFFYLLKIKILQLISIFPSIYIMTVKYRNNGVTIPDWELSHERKLFLKKINVKLPNQ